MREDEDEMEDEEAEDDIAIARERISTRCPLTLREFDDPITSRKCPHTFEKSAIFGLIESIPPSNGRRGANSSNNASKQVNCPITGCHEVC